MIAQPFREGCCYARLEMIVGNALSELGQLVVDFGLSFSLCCSLVIQNRCYEACLVVFEAVPELIALERSARLL